MKIRRQSFVKISLRTEDREMGFHELKQDKQRVLPLFPSVDRHLIIEAVVEEDCDGEVLVDNRETPESAAIWTAPGDEALVYLGGRHDNASFNEQLRTYFNEIVKPRSIERGKDAFEIYFPDDWTTALQTVFGDQIFRDRDNYYRFDPRESTKLRPSWRKGIPNGFSLERVESETIFDRAAHIPVFGDFNSWKSFEKFKRRGFGYCLIENDTQRIVSGCKTKAVAVRAHRCEVAIGTEKHYQGRGFATLVGCATVREAVEKDMEVIWECFHGNEASIRTNQKLGFRYICSQDFFLGFLSESLQNSLFAGYYHLVELNDPERAAWWFNRSMKKSRADNKPISSGYRFHAARAFAELKEHESAIECLQAALNGLQGPGEFRRSLESEPAFDCLRGSQEFEEILRKLEKMACE